MQLAHGVTFGYLGNLVVEEKQTDLVVHGSFSWLSFWVSEEIFFLLKYYYQPG